MTKKIEDFMNRHFTGALIATILIAIIVTSVVGISLIQADKSIYLLYFVVGGCILCYIEIFHQHHKNRKALKKQKNGWSISELKDFYEKQFNVVNQTVAEYNYSLVNDHNWLFTFNKTVRSLYNTINNSRTFSSFDFASCLIYSLSVEPVIKFDNYAHQQLFAFSCAKKLIAKPISYFVETTYPSKVILNFKADKNDASEEVTINFPNEVFTDKVICEIITAYTSSGKPEDLLQFSDVLQKMHSMCCNN